MHDRTCRSIRTCAILAILLLVARPGVLIGAEETFDGWNLEPSLAQAHLVMVARVASISQVTIVEGAKTDTALREFRFQPVRVLKGIFQREQLSMTGADLGLTNHDPNAAPPLAEGEFRLLILVQPSGLSTYGCVSSAPGMTTFAQRVPRVSGPDDPLVASVDTLLEVIESRSRRQRAQLIVERLAGVDGVPAIPLLTSLQSRADWAGTEPRVLPMLSRLIKDPLPATRDAAVQTLRRVLASRNITGESALLVNAADALRDYLAAQVGDTKTRVDAIEGLGYLSAREAELDWARGLLVAQMTAAATYAERVAAAQALSQAPHADSAKAALDVLAGLPLDEPVERAMAYAQAAVKLAGKGAEKVLIDRLQRTIAARQSLVAEVQSLGKLKSEASLPLLVKAGERITAAGPSSEHLSRAFARIRDDRAIPVLIAWMQSSNAQLAGEALAALEAIDSPLAAREVRTLLRTQPNLQYKLRLARLLARHGYVDGYSLATEHLADDKQTAYAALVLAALDDPRTGPELHAILSARADRRWQAAALAGLSAIGDEQGRQRIAEILADERDPLAAGAATAAGLGSDPKLLAALPKLIRSRNEQVAKAALEAVLNFFSNVRISPLGLNAVIAVHLPLETSYRARMSARLFSGDTPNIHALRANLAAAAREVASDPYASATLRVDAFAVARLLADADYPQFLEQLADQSELEGRPLLGYVQTELRELQSAN